MAKELIDAAWIDDLPNQVTGATKTLATAMVPALHVALDNLNEAVLDRAVGASARNAAIDMWQENDPETHGKILPLIEKLTKLQELLVEVQEEYDSAVDKGIKPYIKDASARADELAVAATNRIVERRTELVNILKVATGGQIKAPGIPGSGKSAAGGEVAPRPDLDSAFVDGEPVIPANGEWPVMSDIHRVIKAKYDIQSKVRELSLLIFRTAKTREVPAEGLTVQLDINGNPVEVKMFPRAETDKPQRGRAAK